MTLPTSSRQAETIDVNELLEALEASNAQGELSFNEGMSQLADTTHASVEELFIDKNNEAQPLQAVNF